MQQPLHIICPEIDKTMIRVEPEKILKLLGNHPGDIGLHTSHLVDHYIGECLRVSSPSCAYVLKEAVESQSTDTILIPELSFLSGNIIPKMLHNAQKYAFFIVTAGPGPETLVRTLMEQGNYLESYITDLAASALVEAAADHLQEEIRQLASGQNMKITNRYSPGYCSWGVEEQQKLFRLFPAQCCGITLSESSLMNPVKSASGIIGIGATVEYRDYTCELCTMKDCLFRKVRPR